MCDIYFMGTERIKAAKIEPCCIFSLLLKCTYIEPHLPNTMHSLCLCPKLHFLYYHLQIIKKRAGKVDKKGRYQ